MSLNPATPAAYLAGHLEDALACDPRVTEQGFHVRVEQDPLRVMVAGTVLDPQPKSKQAEVVAELLPQARLQDETSVAAHTEPSGELEENVR